MSYLDIDHQELSYPVMSPSSVRSFVSVDYDYGLIEDVQRTGVDRIQDQNIDHRVRASGM